MPQVAVKLVSETESNYFKIFILIFNISHQAVGIKFDDVIQPDHLRYTLGLNMSKLTSLKDKGYDPTSQTFDTSLMICLLRNLAGIQITNELPLWSELTVGADLSRIMTHRKYISNSNDRTLQNDKFAAIWKEIEDAVIRLSNEKLTIDCSTLQTKNFYVDDSQSIYATIQGWKRLVQIEEKRRCKQI
ncbi:unnamed protein product [Mytilus edulis]|uniref:DZIP3-like HEPN domain-containing protein n=1 Tax=Mytilus edulis TaxID=6550 RepID=A0A8S3RFC3_MYTED|nr:unnamed protein product [Mytilus edulis]